MRIAITTGEPAGIGPEIALRAALQLDAPCVLIGDARVLEERARALGLRWPLPTHLVVEHIPVAVPAEAGSLDPRNARYVLALLERAIDGCARAQYAAMVTAPVHKGVINEAGIAFTGHTEFLAEKTATPHVVMLLVGDVGLNEALRAAGEAAAATPDREARSPRRDAAATTSSLRAEPPGTAQIRDAESETAPLRVAEPATAPLRVALATTHLPLVQVPAAITRESLAATLDVLDGDLRRRFRVLAPRIGVAGLNPHAGEGGHLGREEIETIAPAVEAARARGIDATGPLPADTLFVPRQLARFDAVLAMYHDQGLAPFKLASFGHGVNVTLGLPFVRTSVDHGTALDLAGTGRAEHGSLVAALRLAAQLAAPR